MVKEKASFGIVLFWGDNTFCLQPEPTESRLRVRSVLWGFVRFYRCRSCFGVGWVCGIRFLQDVSKKIRQKFPANLSASRGILCMVTVRIRSVPDRCNSEFRDRPRQPAGHSQAREGKRSRLMCRVRFETLFSLPKPVCTLNARQCFRSFHSVCLIIAYFRPLVKRFCKLFPISANLLQFIRHYLLFSYQFRKNIEKVRIIR